MFDLIIKNGSIYDGKGSEPYQADIAISNEKIVEIGDIKGEAKKVIDAEGKIVTPGFVDIHTHYDGQVTWDPYLRPSTYHGVTTVVMGNCGVGFSPCKPDQRDWLIGLMEGVEDIPGTALHEGIDWEWESFPEYLDALEKKITRNRCWYTNSPWSCKGLCHGRERYQSRRSVSRRNRYNERNCARGNKGGRLWI